MAQTKQVHTTHRAGGQAGYRPMGAGDQGGLQPLQSLVRVALRGRITCGRLWVNRSSYVDSQGVKFLDRQLCFHFRLDMSLGCRVEQRGNMEGVKAGA